MSYHKFSIIQGRAVVDTRVSNAQLRTLCALGMYADKDGWCFPSQSTVGGDLGKSRQMVNEDIATLFKLGYIEKVAVPTGRGKEVFVKYRLVYDLPTVDVEVPKQGMSILPDSNDPMNDPSNDMANEEKPSSLPIDWKIATGQKVTEDDLRQEKNRKMRDTAMLIATGLGVPDHYFDLAYMFMIKRDILIPHSKVKGQRKVVKEMVEMGVQPEHIAEAVDKLLAANMTVTDLYSVSKTAIALANPPKESSHIEGV